MTHDDKKTKFQKFRERNKASNGYLLKKRIKSFFFKLGRAILIFGMCFLILQPLLNKISISFMAERDLYDATVIAIPRNATFDNYKLASQLMNYGTALFNSLWVAILISVIQIAACTLVGYGFARYNFPLKGLLFGCVMMIIIVPPQTIMSSLYLHFRFFDVLGIIKLITGSTINLQNSILPYVLLCGTCMGLKSGLYIFMIRQFYRGIPKELEEAAWVDGCGPMKTFLQIMLPDAKSIITSCFLFAFVWQWTDSFYSKMFLGKITLLPNALTSLSTRLAQYIEQIMGAGAKASVGYTQAMISTGMMMAIIPLIILYLVAQKGFVESISGSGIKM